MGLSGRKLKQRIPDDPRNLSWVDNAARFGTAYLSKFGWDPSKGLGAVGDGPTSHIKVAHKLDMLGIGAANQRDPNGIAWKQNRDFENLLKRLNDGDGEGNLKAGFGFHNAETKNTALESIEQAEATAVDEQKSSKGDRKENKRKRSKDDVRLDDKHKKRRSKVKASEVGFAEAFAQAAEAPIVIPIKTPSAVVPRHRAHRARAIAAKNIASKSPAAISEILGIAPTPSSSATSGTTTPQGNLISLKDTVSIEKITTSTKSVADYFKEKLLNKTSKSTSVLVSKTSPVAKSLESNNDYEDPPRRLGLGAARTVIERGGGAIEAEEKSKLSLLMSSAFLSSKASLTSDEPSLSEMAMEKLESKESRKMKMKEATTSLNAVKKKRRKEMASRGPEDDGQMDLNTLPSDDLTEKQKRKRQKAAKRARKEAKGVFNCD